MNSRHLSCCIAAGGLVLAAAFTSRAEIVVNIGTVNAAAPITSSVTVNVDGAGAASLSGSTLDSLNADIYKSSGGTLASGFGGSFSLSLQVARPIDTLDGTTSTTLTGTSPVNGLGLGVTGTGGGSNQDGNFLGSGSGIFEGVLLSLDTSGLGSIHTVRLLGFTMNQSAASLPMSAGLINAATDTSENFSSASATQLNSFTLATPLTLDGGTALTHIGTFWQPEDNAGWRLKSLTFEVVTVPEPSTLALGTLGMAAGLLMRRRSRRL